MCGIFGILNNNQSTEADIQTAFNNGFKRGPEKSTFCKINNQTSFGFHRLAINGLNDESNQPIHVDNCILICNGEIYNYIELREELENLKFEKQEAVQNAIKKSSLEISELKDATSALRDELVESKFTKKQAIQKAVLNSSDEIKQLKNSTQSLRDELEKVIKNYEKKIQK